MYRYVNKSFHMIENLFFYSFDVSEISFLFVIQLLIIHNPFSLFFCLAILTENLNMVQLIHQRSKN